MEAFIATLDSAEKSIKEETPVAEATEAKATKIEEFAKTATAAKISGAFHETAGMFKRKFGEITDDESLKDAGRNERLLGKLHRFVGSLRGVHESVFEKFTSNSTESLKICRKHGGRILDVASDFVDEIKKVILK